MQAKLIKEIPDSLYGQILRFANTTIYHTQEWHQVLQRTFGWKVQALIGMEADRVTCFLPVISKYRVDCKKHAVCLPLSQRVGVAYEPSSHDSLELFFEQIALAGKHVEIHDTHALSPGALHHSHDVTLLDLRPYETAEDLFKSLDYKSIRYMIHRAEKNQITVTSELTEDNMASFYELMVETRKRQGSPVYPTSFFQNLFKVFNSTNLLSLYLAWHQGLPIAGACFFNFQNTLTYAYAASVNERNLKKLGGNERILWNAIQDAFSLKMRYVDFGITPITLPGLKRFKEKWGGQSFACPYTYFGSTHEQAASVSRDGKLVMFASAILQQCPSSLFRRISPVMLKWVV